MKRNLPLSLLLAVLAIASLGCGRTANTNVDSGLTTNKNVAVEPVNTASIEAEVKKLGREWAGAFKTRDVEAVRRILADDIVITYPDGVVAGKNEEVQGIEAGAITADSWDVVDEKVTVIDAGSAFITGRAVVKNGQYKDPKAPKPIDISGEYRFLDVYARKNGRWQAVASQTTKIAAPAPPAP
jgi:ketosteroid isomerase-like protein